MEKFLERHKLPKLNQETDNNLKIHISVKEMEYVVKYLSTKKIQDQMVLLVNSTKHLRKK